VPRIAWERSLRAMAAAAGTPLVRRHPRTSPSSAFAILVTTMISPRTKDEVTDAAALRLLRRAPTPASLAALPRSDIARLIYPAGFYRTKAASLRQAAARLAAGHQGLVPETMDGLLELPGVGRKIANLVLSRAFGQDAICVDTHVHRISNRRGWVRTRTPEETEHELRRLCPRRFWTALNDVLVGFGKRVCTPQSPRCGDCPVSAGCPREGVARSR